MGFESGSRGNLQSDINVTPLVDVMLVLLIIFMLVTPLLQTGVSVDLPKARNVQGIADDQSQSVTVSIQATQEVLVDGTPLGGFTLAQVLAREFNANPLLELHIKADRNVTYGEVRRAIRAGREAGFLDAALVAEAIEDETSSGEGS